MFSQQKNLDVTQGSGSAFFQGTTKLSLKFGEDSKPCFLGGSRIWWFSFAILGMFTNQEKMYFVASYQQRFYSPWFTNYFFFFKSTFNGTTVNIILLILYHRTVHGILLVHYCIEQQFFGYKSCHNSPMSCHQLKIEQQPNGLKGHCKRLGASRCPQPQMWSL